MKLYPFAALVAFTVGSAAGYGQVAATAAASAAAPHIVAALPALLTSAVSSGSAHAGQAVLAKLARPSVLSDGTKLPAGTQLLGHLTEVKSLAKGSGTSSLGMVFDHFKGADGQQKELASGVLQSVGTGRSQPSSQASASSSSPSQSTDAVGGLLGGVTGAVGNTVGAVGNSVNGLVGTVTSLPGVVLNSTGTLMAKGRNVQVPAGTQVTIAASASAQ